ncbi:MAG: hypothetical protein GX868_14460, partial [Actinobacteria bacterium]|nr:hypothetical protein [Actinomycetota bacterium]
MIGIFRNRAKPRTLQRRYTTAVAATVVAAAVLFTGCGDSGDEAYEATELR